jgi:methylmalonyl-CoA mutase N-terminal domain/subunit
MSNDLKRIEKEKKEWRGKPTQGDETSQREFLTSSGIDILDVYDPTDIVGFDYSGNLGFPGEAPFTRGVYPTMYRGRLWTMRQYAGFGSAEDTNKRFKYLIGEGQTGLSIAFDLPTQMGLDSDDHIAAGEVGKCGVAISSLKDLEVLFQGIPLEKVSTSMTINSTAMVLLAMYVALAEKQGVRPEKLRGTIQNDMLKEYVARGTYIFPPKESIRLITDVFEYCSNHMRNWNTISISGYHIREAGATAVQELAFTLANAIEYINAALSKGMDIDEFASRLSFFFASHNDLFEEVAKFRAARRVWSSIMKERFGAKKRSSFLMRFHVQTSGVTLTAQQPESNVIRVTIQAMAAALGGAQSIHTNSMDEAFALPTEKAVRIALRTQQVIAHESGVVNTIDPLGGSYYLEWLTGEIEKGVMDYVERIDAMGGMLKAIENGYVQKEITESAFRYQRDVEHNKRVVVGVNEYCMAPEPVETLKIDTEIEKKRTEALDGLKRTRNSDEVEKSLEKIRNAARGSDNLFPLVLEAVKSYATIGEITGAMKEVFGAYRPVGIF